MSEAAQAVIKPVEVAEETPARKSGVEEEPAPAPAEPPSPSATVWTGEACQCQKGGSSRLRPARQPEPGTSPG